ncbi:bifunctional folypolyglutamate synthetase / dihydrofolate synthetase [Campylobacter iguaniorum]|uniref:Mur ligase family protein n=1 Tax=Campylobacter iguaniorum TaxID=1244531 RepID=UPI0007C89C09|nr:Mur ligase family protein [Campylobacter iguaniorum]ANE35792.1 bifunctional folypolyglutamate synthetase / dihydrofolate synthetase [Campylobacter iguaniorum]
MSYKDFLNSKPMYYDKIDYTRFPRAYELIKSKLNLPQIIHVVGTNGKGSTGRFLAQILKDSGKKVAHYTSPHIFDFNERFWIDGEILKDEILQNTHEKLLEYFSNLDKNEENFIDTLSYFEWATLMAGVAFETCDEVIMEAGMGGEYDATNVFAKKLSIFTPIGLDHTAMLGDSLEQIATTKLNSMQNQAIISSEFALLDLAKSIALKRQTKLIKAPKTLFQSVQKYADKFALPEFLASNLNLAYFCAKQLGVANLDEIMSNLNALSLQARCQKISSNLTIDVGHNAHGAKALAKHFMDQKVNLIYNSFDDKDIMAVLKELKPIISNLLIYEYESFERKLAGDKIQKIAAQLGIKCAKFTSLKDDENYLVFGSFVLVYHFIKETLEK